MPLTKFALALGLASLLCCAHPAWALPADLVLAVGAGESDERVAAVGKLVASGDPGVEAFFQALLDGNVQVAGGKRVLIVKNQQGIDAATGDKVEPLPDDLDDAVVRLAGPVGMADVVAAYLDNAAAEPAVSDAIEVIDSADLGDEDAEFTVGDAQDHDLAWYASQELPFLLDLLDTQP